MRGFALRTLVTAAGLALAAWIVPDITMSGPLPLLLAAFLMGIVNAFIRPVIVVLTLPITIVTLGLFLLVVNAATFGLVAWLLGGFEVAGFFPALFGWLIVSAVAWVASWCVGSDGRYRVIVVERRC